MRRDRRWRVGRSYSRGLVRNYTQTFGAWSNGARKLNRATLQGVTRSCCEPEDARDLVPLPTSAQPTLAPRGMGLVRRGDGALPLAAGADHSFLGAATCMTRVTFGKSRVRESRMF